MNHQAIGEAMSAMAASCLDCRLCLKECIMLGSLKKTPKHLFQDYLDQGILTVDPMIAYSCNECSQCTLRCPRKLNLKEVFRALKASYAEENAGIVPLPSLLPSEEGQVKECNPDYCTTISGTQSGPVEKRKTKYVFVPGCTIPAYSPSAVENIVHHLRECLGKENVGAMLQCCGKVSRFMGEEEKFHARNKIAIDKLDEMGCEVIITVCPSCFKIFKETAKHQRVISYWDLMHDLIGIPESAKGIGKDSDIVFNIHDSCVTRDEPTHHESIRWVLDQMGYQWEEIGRSREKTRCCGVGGMVCSSDPALYEQVYTRRKGDFSSNHVISYCGSCRGTFETAGMDSLHILDLLFSRKTYTADQEHKRSVRSPDEMWANRLESKSRLEGLHHNKDKKEEGMA